MQLGTIGRSNSKVTAADGAGFVHVGKGDAVAASEIAKTKGDGKDNLVVVSGQDVYAASSSRIKIEWTADANRASDGMVINMPGGKQLSGAVVAMDREASNVAERKEAQRAREAREREARPFTFAGVATALLGVVVGLVVPTFFPAAIVMGPVASVLGGAGALLILGSALYER
jgi:hypothetical protein